MSPPEKIGKYKVESVLGKGAMGIVYLAVDPHIERKVAIKTLLLKFDDSPEILERFRREAKAAGALNHPNVVTVYDYGEDNGTPYIVMELITGKDLQATTRHHAGRLPVERSLKIILQVLDALSYCHAAGVVHRDMKPANIVMLDNDVAKVTDFGIARQENSDLTATGMVLGTPSYMSPEQFIGETVDGRSDLFSTAVVLYELLTGAQPFQGDTVPTIMYKVSHEDASPPSQINAELPPSFDRLMQKALAKKPADRFATALEFSEALKQAAHADAALNEDSFHSDATVIAGAVGSLPSDATGHETNTRPNVARIAVGGIAAAAVIAAALWFWVLGVTEYGSVSLISEPAGAQVWLSDELLGTTPVDKKLPVGTHLLVMKKDAFQDLEINVEVEPGIISDIYLPLTAK